MVKDNLSKKGLVVAVILLFIGLAIAPSINANVSNDSEMVEYAIELCGVGGGKKTVKLTKEQSQEVDDLFISVKEKLNATSDEEEIEKILNDAITKLKEYGLLGGLSFRQAQRIFQMYTDDQKNFDLTDISGKENGNCIIVGEIKYAYFMGPLALPINNIINLDFYYMFYSLGLYIVLYTFFSLIFGARLFPLRIGSSIIIGYYAGYYGKKYPTRGWIFTTGSRGNIEWDGELYGELQEIYLLFAECFVGVAGFFGIKLYNFEKGKTSILGFARDVKIAYW